ncbi:MAG: hypothetical protein HQL32_15210, partial [Planctomycetes bacterium]|nr:hypothetical protein [Planctomycetota bacterium]
MSKHIKKINLALLSLGAFTLIFGQLNAEPSAEKKNKEANQPQSSQATDTAEQKSKETKQPQGSQPADTAEQKSKEANHPQSSQVTDAAPKAKPPEEEKPVNLGGLNLMSLEVKKLLPKLSEWTGKVIIPVDSDLLRLKISLYSKKKHTQKQILKHIYSALFQSGYVIEEYEEEILIKKISDSKLGIIPTIGDNTPLASIEDKTQKVQKIFKLKMYPPNKMKDLLSSMNRQNRNFQIISDEKTSTLIVIDTVGSLMGIAKIIEELDIPAANEDDIISVTIPINQGNPQAIAQVLKSMLDQDPYSSSRHSRYSKGNAIGFKGPSGQNVILIPVLDQNWIIVRSAKEDIPIIKEWVEKLDIQEGEEAQQEMVP